VWIQNVCPESNATLRLASHEPLTTGHCSDGFWPGRGALLPSIHLSLVFSPWFVACELL
jgi:hypothetical protein